MYLFSISSLRFQTNINRCWHSTNAGGVSPTRLHGHLMKSCLKRGFVSSWMLVYFGLDDKFVTRTWKDDMIISWIYSHSSSTKSANNERNIDHNMPYILSQTELSFLFVRYIHVFNGLGGTVWIIYKWGIHVTHLWDKSDIILSFSLVHSHGTSTCTYNYMTYIDN